MTAMSTLLVTIPLVIIPALVMKDSLVMASTV